MKEGIGGLFYAHEGTSLKARKKYNLGTGSTAPGESGGADILWVLGPWAVMATEKGRGGLFEETRNLKN